MGFYRSFEIRTFLSLSPLSHTHSHTLCYIFYFFLQKIQVKGENKNENASTQPPTEQRYTIQQAKEILRIATIRSEQVQFNVSNGKPVFIQDDQVSEEFQRFIESNTVLTQDGKYTCIELITKARDYLVAKNIHPSNGQHIDGVTGCIYDNRPEIEHKMNGEHHFGMSTVGNPSRQKNPNYNITQYTKRRKVHNALDGTKRRCATLAISIYNKRQAGHRRSNCCAGSSHFSRLE